jgi:succinate-semialdehyde dehydrogenase/glutarate-semialdehyde dehydrogenase
MLLAWHLAAVGAEVIRFLSPAFEGDRRELYAFQLLRLALSKTSRYFGCLLKSRKLAKERSELLRRWFELVRDDKRVFAEIMVKENGKCLSEAFGEIDYGLDFIEWYAEEAKRVYGDTIPSHASNAAVLVVKEPVGPTAAITPWNFPFMMITRKIATALAAGCTMIIKPAEETPLTAYKLLEHGRTAGIPEGVFEMVTAIRRRSARSSRQTRVFGRSPSPGRPQ